MNGEVLEPSHGYPLRLFVPGWYGVASVKWLRRIEVVNEPFRGYFQSVKYTFHRRTERGVESEIVGPMMPKSEIIRPRAGDVLNPGGNRLFGVAWAGEDIHHSRSLRLRVASGRRAADVADAETILYDMNAYGEENMRRPLDVELAFSAGEGI
jgi:DMSO/TMAO reductase YedYZ molybdopterin-dependent catalytic subunit